MAIERLEGMGSKHSAVTTIYRLFEIFAALRIRPADQLQLRIFAVQLMLLPEPLAHTCAPCVHASCTAAMHHDVPGLRPGLTRIQALSIFSP
jgi:hypothetical protein